MTKANEEVDVVVQELRACGIKPQVERTPRHIAISWQAGPDKPPRTVIVSSTPSDWRGRLNARAEVRRYLRADNISLREQAKPAPLAQRIIGPPRHVETTPDQVAAMRSEVADLTELCLELADVVARTAAVLVPRREAEQKKGRRLDALAHIPNDGTATTTDAIAAALRVDRKSAYSRLENLRRRGVLVRIGGQWARAQRVEEMQS